MRKKPQAQTFSVAEHSYFMVELARGASHIASCTSVASTTAAINDVNADFLRNHGPSVHLRFLEELARRLEEKNRRDAAASVRQLRAEGVLLVPPATQSGTRARKGRSAANTLPSRANDSENDSQRQGLAA